MENEKLLGLYGGTFDPPHKAHLALAKTFTQSAEGARLIVMPCLIPPHKTKAAGGADAADRLAMAKLCFEGVAEVSDYELNKKRTSYTHFTVKHLKRKYPKYKICLIMGQDNLEIIEKWKEYLYLLENCAFAVALRGDEEISPKIDYLRQRYKAEIYLLPMEKQNISSTEIRRRLIAGESTEGLLTDEVYDYIKREGLYR